MSEIILHITAGDGPKECAWVVRRLVDVFMREAKAESLTVELLTEPAKTLPSALCAVRGEGAERFAQELCGTIKWIGESPFRPRHKRKNWFVGVSLLPSLDELSDIEARDVRFTAMKASGPGGQHVNKTNSAVRAVHVPSGLTVTAQDSRSQHANKRLCLIKLAALIEDQRSELATGQERNRWQTHKSLERGNAVRVYVGVSFRRKT